MFTTSGPGRQECGTRTRIWCVSWLPRPVRGGGGQFERAGSCCYENGLGNSPGCNGLQGHAQSSQDRFPHAGQPAGAGTVDHRALGRDRSLQQLLQPMPASPSTSCTMDRHTRRTRPSWYRPQQDHQGHHRQGEVDERIPGPVRPGVGLPRHADRTPGDQRSGLEGAAVEPVEIRRRCRAYADKYFGIQREEFAAWASSGTGSSRT